ncbi:MAG: ubiquinone biosynthesis methyltransferase UbiE [Yoonia sp.]|nr:ubiquinone biosynthesis methyltransferase UbiE [Yoonia sp.]
MVQTTTRLPLKPVDYVKWIATAIQLIGYGLTGLNYTPWNIYAFLVGIFLWFAVGFMWKDRAIMVVHVGAFISLTIGYLNAA